MSRAILAAVVVGMLVAVALTTVLARAGDSGHTCQAPCRVTFVAKDMQEDMFAVDYHGGVLDVRQVTP